MRIEIKVKKIIRNFYYLVFFYIHIWSGGFSSFETIKIKADVAQWLLGPGADHSWKYLFSKF